jgi:hypothetical protein
MLPPSYPNEDLNAAVENVESGRMALCMAAKLYKISKATLFKNVKGMIGVKAKCWVNQLPSLSMKREKNCRS